MILWFRYRKSSSDVSFPWLTLVSALGVFLIAQEHREIGNGIHSHSFHTEVKLPSKIPTQCGHRGKTWRNVIYKFLSSVNTWLTPDTWHFGINSRFFLFFFSFLSTAVARIMSVLPPKFQNFRHLGGGLSPNPPPPPLGLCTYVETARNLHNSYHCVSLLRETRSFAKCFHHYSA